MNFDKNHIEFQPLKPNCNYTLKVNDEYTQVPYYTNFIKQFIELKNKCKIIVLDDTNTYKNKINSSSIIQIYARVPYPGAKFLKTHKNTLYKLFNYNIDFYDTPQDLACIAIPPE